MSIRILTDSHIPHITASNISVPTSYLMTINDFYNGYGVALNADGTTYNSNFILPQIGTKYIQFYFLNNLTDTFWSDVVLTDITGNKTTAQSPGDNDTSSWDLDKMVEIIYTWSNSGKKDIVTPGDPSSMKFELTTNTQIETTDLVVDAVVDPGKQYLASDLYFSEKNPTIYIYGNEGEEPVDKGPYEDATDAEKRYHRENNDSPPHEVYATNTILTVTAYSKKNYTWLLTDNLNKINSKDFLANPYTTRESRLIAKGRLQTADYTDIATQDDSYKWLFHDFLKTESGIDMYKYTFTFLYNPDTWRDFYGALVTEYEEIDFTVMLNNLFNIGV